MNENDKSRSGLQTAVDFAHAARAAKRIMQAAAVSGVHGAAAATAREAFPLLLKILIAALVVFIVVPTEPLPMERKVSGDGVGKSAWFL